MRPSAALAFIVLGCAGCALMSKAETLDVRYFAPEVPQAPREGHAKPAASTASGLSVRMGRISASAHLRKYLVSRPTAVELKMDSALWWAEAPEDYLQRAVIDALFVENPVEQSLSGDSPTLDSELLAFEEVTENKKPKARVSIRFALHDQIRVLLAGTVTVDRALREEDDPEELAKALGDALEEATDQLAGRVVARLEEGVPPPVHEASASSAP
jgi:hypothetical protein